MVFLELCQDLELAEGEGTITAPEYQEIIRKLPFCGIRGQHSHYSAAAMSVRLLSN